MTIEQMRTLSDEDLMKLSMKKNSKGNYTIAANQAMRIRRERNGHWEDVSSRAPSFEKMLLIEQGYCD